jgi:hypothetical protein
LDNCLESLPVFAVIVLAAFAMNQPQAVAALAPWVFYARVGQTLAHLSGVGPQQIFARATFWTIQLGLCVRMGIGLLPSVNAL